MFSKGFLYRVVKSCDCDKELNCSRYNKEISDFFLVNPLSYNPDVKQP